MAVGHFSWKCQQKCCRYIILYGWEVECVCLYGQRGRDMLTYTIFHRESCWGLANTLINGNSLDPWDLSLDTAGFAVFESSCGFLMFYSVFQEWFGFKTAGFHQGSTKTYLKHIFPFLTHLTKQTYTTLSVPYLAIHILSLSHSSSWRECRDALVRHLIEERAFII